MYIVWWDDHSPTCPPYVMFWPWQTWGWDTSHRSHRSHRWFSINLDKEVGYAMVQYSIMIIMPTITQIFIGRMSFFWKHSILWGARLFDGTRFELGEWISSCTTVLLMWQDVVWFWSTAVWNLNLHPEYRNIPFCSQITGHICENSSCGDCIWPDRAPAVDLSGPP